MAAITLAPSALDGCQADYMKNLQQEHLFYRQKTYADRPVIFKQIIAENPTESRDVQLALGLAAFLNAKEIIVDRNDLLAGHIQHCDYYHSIPSMDIQLEIDAYIATFGAHAVSSQSENASASQLLTLLSKGISSRLYSRYPSGHVIAGYASVLRSGFGGLIKQVEELVSSKEAEHSPQKKSCWRAFHITLKAAAAYALRYADNAAHAAKKTDHPKEKERLEKIASACSWISHGVPRSFYEAAQLFWITHEIIMFEQQSGSLSIGRLDQFLYPWYEADIMSGAINPQEAYTIVEALWIKFSGCRQSYQNLTIGGYSLDRQSYAANDLSYMCLRACRELKQDQPLLAVRWNSLMPEAFMKQVQLLIETGIGFPALFNDDTAIRAMMNVGVSEEDAQDYGLVGCVELSVPGKEYGNTEIFRINWAKVLEMMLNNGKDIFTDEHFLATRTDLESVATFGEFYAWYKKELIDLLRKGIEATNLLDITYGTFWPSPFLSVTMAGCIDSGKDATAGGTRYNFSSVNGCGMANIVDSLVAIKHLVFEEKALSLTDLAQILRNNYAGHEPLRRQIQERYAKFGNDNEEADGLMRELIDMFCDVAQQYRSPRGGGWQCGMYSVENHAFMGEKTGALPDGKLLGFSLASALSPAHGADRAGPTAVMKSIARLDHTRFANGMVLDMKFTPGFFETDNHRIKFKHLIETYFHLGGLEVQFNVISRETLIDARLHPENHRNLIVRVSGFSAYFVTLATCVQEEIIARTEYMRTI